MHIWKYLKQILTRITKGLIKKVEKRSAHCYSLYYYFFLNNNVSVQRPSSVKHLFIFLKHCLSDEGLSKNPSPVVQVQLAVAGLLEDIHGVVPKTLLRCLGCVRRVIVMLEGELSAQSEVLSTLNQGFIKDISIFSCI